MTKHRTLFAAIASLCATIALAQSAAPPSLSTPTTPRRPISAQAPGLGATPYFPPTAQLPMLNSAPVVEQPALPSGTPTRMRQRASVVMQNYFEAVPQEEVERTSKWQQLQRSIQKTDDEQKRTELAGELKTLLQTVFDEDLDRQDNDLKQLEARVKKLRDAIEHRRSNRDRIINLQIETVMLAAEGLTFPGAPTPTPIQAYSGALAPTTAGPSSALNTFFNALSGAAAERPALAPNEATPWLQATDATAPNTP